MFERFTDRARRVVVLAQEEARRLNHNYIGTEHILLGLIQEGEGHAAKALEELNINIESVRSEVVEIIGEGQQSPSGHIPFTPRAKKVLELSLREALQLGHNYIGTEHILLGLIREGEGVAAQVLKKLGAELSQVRQTVIKLISNSDEGKKLAITLLYKKGINLKGNNPCFLWGYGSYGSTYDPWFSSNIFSLVDRGMVYARAHIRGSSFMGRKWYLDGKLKQKKNTFEDFISAGRFLENQGITSSGKLAIYGGSAGGLLIGAVMNMAPDLCKVAIPSVPFVDVINTMLDESIPLTVGEFEEWGNPKEKDYYDYMKSYSPYDNVEAKAYPHTLVLAGYNDPRVQYWEPAKWTAKLRNLKKDDNDLLLKTIMEAGHFSSSGRFDYLKDVAFYYAFILDKLEIN